MYPVLTVLKFYVFGLSYSSVPGDLILAPGERLKQGDKKQGVNGRCEIELQRDGNLVVRKDGENAWSSGSHNVHDDDDHGPFFLKLNKGGALVIRGAASSDIGMRSKSNDGGGPIVFSTNTRGTRLINDRGGLFFNPDCSVSIRANEDDEDDIWTNVRDRFYSGNRLDKGEMIRYPPRRDGDESHTLLLQNDGNLVMFKGRDLTDYDGPQDVLWGAGVTASSDRFFLKLTCDGQMLLKERVDNDLRVYWNMTLESVKNGPLGAETKVARGGYSLVLKQDHQGIPFGYEPIHPDCLNSLNCFLLCYHQ